MRDVRGADPRRPPVPRRARRPRRAVGARRAALVARAGGGQVRRARRARRVPGLRAVGPLARRSRQPAPGGLRPPPRARSGARAPSSRGAATPRAALARRLSAPDALADGRAKLLLLRVALAPPPRAARPLPRRRTTARSPRRAPSPRHVLAFARTHGRDAVLCAVPRLVLRPARGGRRPDPLGGDAPPAGGAPAPLPRRRDRSAPRGRGAPARRLFADFPVALLASE